MGTQGAGSAAASSASPPRLFGTPNRSISEEGRAGNDVTEMASAQASVSLQSNRISFFDIVPIDKTRERDGLDLYYSSHKDQFLNRFLVWFSNVISICFNCAEPL